MLNELIKNNKLDALFISDINTIKFLFNFSGSNAFALLSLKKFFFVTDARYELQASLEIKDAEVLIYDNINSFNKVLTKILNKNKLKKIGFFSDKTFYSTFVNLSQICSSLVPISYSLSMLRMVKKPKEIQNIKKAIYIQEKAFEDSFSSLFNKPTEAEFSSELDAKMLLNGSQKSSFDTIVAFGKNSACPHHSTSNKKVFGTGSLIIDFGAKYKSYCSDQTVTLFFGKVNSKLEKIYDLIYELRIQILNQIKPGLKFSFLQNIVDSFFDKNSCLEFSKHGLGHGLGLEIHEEPLSWRNSDIVLEENMVFTIEPGLYIPNLGGVRLEDIVLVKASGLEILTNLPKEKKYIL